MSYVAACPATWGVGGGWGVGVSDEGAVAKRHQTRSREGRPDSGVAGDQVPALHGYGAVNSVLLHNRRNAKSLKALNTQHSSIKKEKQRNKKLTEKGGHTIFGSCARTRVTKASVAAARRQVIPT